MRVGPVTGTSGNGIEPANRHPACGAHIAGRIVHLANVAHRRRLSGGDVDDSAITDGHDRRAAGLRGTICARGKTPSAGRLNSVIRKKFHIASGIGHTPDEPWSPRRFIWAPTVAKITRTARPLSDRCPAHQTSAMAVNPATPPAGTRGAWQTRSRRTWVRGLSGFAGSPCARKLTGSMK